MDDDRTLQEMIAGELDVVRRSYDDAVTEGREANRHYWDGQKDALQWVLKRIAWIEKRDRVQS